MQSEVVIARSGYSSIMDLVKLRASKVLLVPTPGQTEQEYLAGRFAEHPQFTFQLQKQLNIEKALNNMSGEVPLPEFQDNNNPMNGIVEDFLSALK